MYLRIFLLNYELFFVDLPTPIERKEIIEIYIRRGLKRDIDPTLVDELVQLSEGFAGSDLEAAVREVVKEAYLNGDDVINTDLFRQSFENVVPLSQTSPEQIEAIRNWGRERAVPASGHMQMNKIDKSTVKMRRAVLQ